MIERFLSLAKNLPDIVCISETSLTSLKLSVSCVDMILQIRISNGNQSEGVSLCKIFRLDII